MTFTSIKNAIATGWNTFIARAPIIIAAMIAGSLLTVFATQADAQPNCLGYDAFVEGLAVGWDEHPAFVGVVSGDPDTVIMIFASADGGSWTLAAVNGGVACIAAEGQQSAIVDLPAPGEPM